MSKYDIKNTETLQELNKKLTTQMFIGGEKPNADDAEVFEQFGEDSVSAKEYPGLAGWYFIVRYFTPEIRKSWSEEVKPKGGKPTKDAPKKEEKTETKKEEKADDDLFGDDDAPESEEAIKKREEKRQAALEAKKAKGGKKDEKKKEAVIGKSLIILDVKVFEMDQNLDELAKKILAITKEGLTWKTEYKTPTIAFGMKKLVIGCVVVDEKVSIDEDVIDVVTSWEDEVQSVDIASFDKI